MMPDVLPISLSRVSETITKNANKSLGGMQSTDVQERPVKHHERRRLILHRHNAL